MGEENGIIDELANVIAQSCRVDLCTCLKIFKLLKTSQDSNRFANTTVKFEISRAFYIIVCVVSALNYSITLTTLSGYWHVALLKLLMAGGKLH